MSSLLMMSALTERCSSGGKEKYVVPEKKIGLPLVNSIERVPYSRFVVGEIVVAVGCVEDDVVIARLLSVRVGQRERYAATTDRADPEQKQSHYEWQACHDDAGHDFFSFGALKFLETDE